MASITQDLFDRQVAHSLRLRRYSDSGRLLLEKASVRHRSRLSKVLRRAIGASVEPEVNQYIQELYGSSKNVIDDLFGAEIDFQTSSLDKGVSEFYKVRKPSRTQLAREFTRQPLRLSVDQMDRGTMRRGFEMIGQSEVTRINARIRRGLANGLSEESIIKDVLKTSRLSENQAKTLFTTTFTQADSFITESVARENEELFSGVVYTAILDSRTSSICSSLDNKFMTLDNIQHRPPLHWNCRSTLSYVLKSKERMLEAAANNSRFKFNVLSGKTPDALPPGQPAKETFDQWLKRQSHETKIGYLGSDEKVSLFERGTLSISDFLSAKGNPLSIASVRVKDNLATFFSPVRTRKMSDKDFDLGASRPFQLVRSKKLQQNLRSFYIADSVNAGNPLSLVDYKGTTLGGKRGVRKRSNNEFDPRVNQADPFTGEIRNSYIYSPDFSVYRERIDYMRESKLLDRKQKDFIEEFADSLGARVSINQRTAIVENLRIVFERYGKDKIPWDDLPSVLRKEMNYSVVNTSRILDRRSRSRAELFDGFTGDVGEPSVMILGEKVTLSDLETKKIDNERFADSWDKQFGRKLARELFLNNKIAMRTYLTNRVTKPKSMVDKIIDSYKKKAIRETIYRDDPTAFYLKYGKIPSVKDIIKDTIEKSVKGTLPFYETIKKLSDEGLANFVSRVVRENYRYIVDLEFFYNRKRLSASERALKALTGELGEDYYAVFSKINKTIAEGITTDYDSLAISVGKAIVKNWPGFEIKPSSMSTFHQEGSRILEFYRKSGLLRVNSRGVTRRAITDMDTLRPSGAWKDTVSREIEIVDPDMLALQSANRKILLANRIGTSIPENRYYVRPNQKEYFDARGRNTGIPMITRSAYADFDSEQVDRDFADMLNHQMDSQYEVDPEFATFMDNLVRFKDQRGNAAKYDELNGFREEIVRRGDLGYGLMETVRYRLAKGTPFSVNARIDSRGRIYYNGYLTPTGGEVIRPFLNSAKAVPMTPSGIDQIRIQMAAVIGPGTEALTQAGRRAIFKRHEKSILRIGEIMSQTTQRDRRIREFLEDPFMQSIDSEEIAKIARFALEYYRVHKHTGGDVNNPAKLATYQSKLMGEADASASGLQVIALSTGNRGAALTSNVVPTRQKQRVYDLTAQDTVADPRFQEMQRELGIELTWEDLSKAAKYQNMIALYGAGQTGQTARVAQELAEVLRKKDFTVTTRAEFLAVRKQIDSRIKEAEKFEMEEVALELKGVRSELEELVNNPQKIADDSLLIAAEEIHPDVANFVQKYTNNRTPRIGPDNFKLVARILSEKLAERAPVTQVYIDFWKRVATDYAASTKKVDIPWVTFDGKKLTQKYRPKVQHEIRFYDPESGRYIRNIYQMSAEDGKLLGKASIGDVRLGLAVNGNHSLDASLLRMYHLEGRRKGLSTASIHDAIFHNISELDEGTLMFFRAYQRARDYDNITATMKAIRDAGLPEELYRSYMKEAEDLGFFENGFSSEEILASLKPGYDRYGIGP